MGTATKGTATRTESLLRPREIQVRIRSGESPEAVAAAAQTSVERVMAFATPVLAERAFVAQQAAKASVRRRGGDGPVGLLGDAVAVRLESAGTDPESVEWDAWRREDGRWTVVAQYADGADATATQRAEFTYDAVGRYVTAEDDPARWLVGERRSVQPPQDLRREVPSPPQPHGAGEQVDGPGGDLARDLAGHLAGQMVLGDDALRVVTGRSLTPVTGGTAVPDPAAAPNPAAAPDAAVTDLAEDPTEDLTEVARSVRAAGEPVPRRYPDALSGTTPQALPDALPEALPGPTLRRVPPPAAATRRTVPEQAMPEQAMPEQAMPAPATAGTDEASAGDGLFEDAGLRTSPELAAERRQAAPSRPRSRRSMPSWDDIMLGSAPRGD